MTKPDRLDIDAINFIRDMSLRNAAANNGENRPKKKNAKETTKKKPNCKILRKSTKLYHHNSMIVSYRIN